MVAEFGSPASATLFGRFDPERRNELNRADVTEMFHDPACCEGLDGPIDPLRNEWRCTFKLEVTHGWILEEHKHRKGAGPSFADLSTPEAEQTDRRRCNPACLLVSVQHFCERTSSRMARKTSLMISPQ